MLFKALALKFLPGPRTIFNIEKFLRLKGLGWNYALWLLAFRRTVYPDPIEPLECEEE